MRLFGLRGTVGNSHILIWRNLTAHPLRSVLTALAIALGVGMMLAAAIVGQAASQSASELDREGPRIDLELLARDGTLFDGAVLDTLRASPNVELASPSLRLTVEVIRPEDSPLTLLGVEPGIYRALYKPELTNGAFLDAPDAIVLPVMAALGLGLNVGDVMTVRTNGREITLTVSGRLKAEAQLDNLTEASVAYVPLRMAQNLRDAPGQIERATIALRDGADIEQAKRALSAHLDASLSLVRAAGGGGILFPTLVIQVGLAMVGLIILFAAAFVIMNAFAMSVTARTQEIGALRALGMTRRQVLLQVLGEAGLLGLTGTVVGLLVGVGLAWGVMRLRGTLDEVVFAVPWWGVGVSATMGIGVTLIGALQPARQASSVSPLMALRAAGATGVAGWYVRRGGRVGAVLLLGLLPGLIAAAFILKPDFFQSFVFLGLGVGLTLLGVALSMPALVAPLARLIRQVLVRRMGTAGRLAADNLGRNRLRTALTAGALTIGLTTIIATSAIMTASLKGGLRAFFGLFHEDGMIIPDIPALIASGEITIENSMSVAGIPLDPALVEAVEALDTLAPGQRALDHGTLVYYGFAPVPNELSTMLGAPGVFVEPEVFLPLGNFDFFEGDVGSALEMMRRGRAVLLMPIVAERLGLSVGDEVVVETPRQGAVAFTVAGIGGTSTNFSVFAYTDGETYFGLTHPSWLGIALPEAGSLDVDEMLALVEETIAPFEEVVVFDMRGTGVGGLIQIVDQLQMLLNALLLLAVIVAALGVVNTMVINVAERGREIGLLRAVGATQRQVRQMIVAEAGALGVMAALLATMLGLVVLGFYSVVFLPNGAASVGVRTDWEVVGLSLWPGLRDLGIAAAVSLVLGPLVAALAAYIPARQAAAVDVVEATRSERVTLKRSTNNRRERPHRPKRQAKGTRSLAWTMAWRNLTAHPLRSVLTALAIALGVGMLLAAAVVGQAASQSASGLDREGPRVDLELLARDGTPFDGAVLETLRASPDVERLSPSLHVEVLGIDPAIPRLMLRGVDPAVYQALHAPELAGGLFLDGSETIVLPMTVALSHGLRQGDRVTLSVGNRTAVLTVAGRLASAAGIAEGRVSEAFVPLDVAQALGGIPGEIDRVEIDLKHRTDLDRARVGLSDLVGSRFVVVQVETGRGVAFNTALIQGGLAMVGLMILFTAGFVILNAFAMSVAARTREIGALRALGMTRRQVLRSVLAEASLLSLIGAGVGMLLGLGLAWAVMRARGLLGQVPFAVPWWGVVLSPLMGLAVTLIGALQPARRAGRVSPIVAVRPEATATPGWYVRSGGRVGLLLLLVLLPALTAYGLIGRPDIWRAMAATGLGIAGLLAATVLLLPALVAPAAKLCRPLLIRWLGTAGRLAADNLSRNRLRSALTVGALVAGLTMIVAASGLLRLFLEGSIGLIGSAMHEDMVVTADLVQMMTSGEMTLENIYQSMADLTVDPAVADALAPLVEAGVIRLERVGIAPVPPELATVPTGRESAGMFVDLDVFFAIGNFDFYEGDPETALQWARRGRAVLLQPLAAERLGVGVGDTIPIETSGGEVEFTVAGVGGSALFSPIFPYTDGQTCFDMPGLFQLGIVLVEGQDDDAVLAQVKELIAPFPGVLVMEDMDSILDEAAGLFDRFRALLNALLLLAVIVAGLGVVNTMVINVTERSREIGLLRAVGATQRQVRQAVVAEAATLGLTAALAAIVLGLLMLLVYAAVVMPNGWGALGMRADGATVRGQLFTALGDMGIAAARSLIFGPLVAGLAAYYPARQAATLNAVEVTRSERVTLKRSASRRPERTRRPKRQARGARSLAWAMAWRNLRQSRTRTVLSALAVALGVAMTVAADVISQAMMNSLAGEDAETFLVGLLDQLDRMLVLIGVMITAAAGFLIFNAFAMAVTQRRQQIGALRSLGMTRRQVLRLVFNEAVIVGGLGTSLGLIAGPLLARGTIAFIKALLGEGLFTFSQSQPSVGSLLLAAVLGVGITLLSVLIPAWRAARVSPLAALRESMASGIERASTWPALVGLALGVALFVYLAVAPPGEWVQPPWDVRLTAALVGLWLLCLGLMLPALIGGVGRGLRGLLARLWGATGRLTADNLQRSRGRVTVTVLTLAVGLTTIVSTTGFIRFAFEELMRPKMEGVTQLGAWIVTQFEYETGMAGYAGQDSLALSPEAVAAVQEVAQDRAEALGWYFAVVPELSFFGSSYFSFVVDPRGIQGGGDQFFSFNEGSWDTALPVMESGCGVLMAPSVAAKNGVSLGERFAVTGADGPVECTVAGIGSPYVGASIVGLAAGESFGIVQGVSQPLVMLVWPRPVDARATLEADLTALVDRQPGLYLSEMGVITDLQIRVFDKLPSMFNAMLLLAIVAAALGVVNTTVMSVAERRRELGLLRAVGATRRQVSRIVTGEAALMGVVGGGLGLVAGVGVTVILVVVYGGNAWGIPDLDLWPAAWRSAQPALGVGLFGLFAAPFICAGAAWLPVRSILRGSTVETLQPPFTSPRMREASLLRRGSIRTRFVLGTAVLTLVLLTGLTTAVTAHERGYLEDWMRETLAMMVEGQAGFIELNLPDGVQSLALTDLEVGEFDANDLLRFRALMDDMSAYGFQQFAVTDGDNVVLLGLDPREMGTLLPALETPDATAIVSEREAGEWRMRAAAPIQNDAGQTIGSVRMTVSLAEVEGLLDKTRGALWAVGGVITALAIALSWSLTTPLVSATERLAAQAARVAEGEYMPLAGQHRQWAWLTERTSLRLRLTAALIAIVVLLVGALEVATVPIQRRHVERELKEGMAAAAEWLGQATSEGLEAGLLPEQSLSLEELFDLAGTMDWARLQELTEKTRSEDVAFVALMDRDGVIQFSDQLSLIGETASVPAETRVEETRWRDEEMWVISTPLRRGQGGEPVGGLRMGLRRAGVEAFLNESRTLFRLSGLIALLVGVLLAQAVGGAVTAPVRQLASGVRRVGEGDLGVQFRVDARDELSLLAAAFNHMVAGLREREWLRDMFGRFVSREVAEAIRSGQVRLEGENRVVSVLFCDIRDFTARSARCTPEQMVALLNEYLPVVVEAAQRHTGTVNKFGGDSTLIIYGAPRPLQESAYRAVLTALEMRTNLAALNARLEERGETPIRIGVGINTGVALAGAVGPEERQEYTVIGDTVNLASRIEALNKEYPDHDVLISGWTYEALGSRRDEFEFADLGELPIRGKAELVHVWAVVGYAG